MKKFLLITGCLVFAIGRFTMAQPILYVDKTATGGNDGSSWVNAYTKLSAALTMANADPMIHEIHVAEGTYFPTGTPLDTNRHQAFIITRGGLSLLGGYAQGGGARDWELYPSVLSGDIGSAGIHTDNSLHVLEILAAQPGTDSILVAGFIIQHGYANNNGTDTINGQLVPGNQGAGMYVRALHLRLAHLKVRENYAAAAGAGIACIHSKIKMYQLTIIANNSDSLGGGIYLAGGHATLSSLQVTGNKALLGGGILADTGSHPVVLHTLFKGNTATSKGAGWYNASGAMPKLFNPLFSGNKATYQGSAWYSENNDSVLLVQATIAGNKADYNGGGALHMQDHDTFNKVCLINSIVWGNSAGIVGGISISHSLIESGSAGTWNQDPYFVHPVADDAAPDTLGDYRLSSCSPVLNLADGASLPAFLNRDVAGNPRIYDSAPDPGCYELQQEPYSNHRLYVDSSRTISGDGQSWATAYKTLSEALKLASECESIDSILVAKGTYFPTGVATGSERDSTFLIPASGLRLFGGYPSGGGLRSVPDYPTRLSGAIGDPADTSDNSYHVLLIAGVTDSVIIDGFYIQSGMANGTGATNYNNVSVSRDKGAGIYLASPADSFVLIQNSKLLHNHAESGAGMYSSNAFALLKQVVISGNQASSRGGGLYAYAAVTSAINCLISGNWAASQAGAIYNNNNSTLKLISSTLSGNATSSGTTGGIYNTASSDTRLQNSIIYGNSGEGLSGGTSFRTYSLVQGWPGGANGNINGNTDPLFVQPVSFLLSPTTAGDYRLLPCSPLINQGDHFLLPPDLLLDLHQQTRVYSTDVDPGAYELQQEAGLPSDTATQTVCNGDSVWFQGQYYHASGFYTDTLPAGACDSLTVLHLIVLPLPVILPVQTLDSCLQVSFEGQVYISDTLLVDTIKYSGFNCDSVYRQTAIQVFQPDSGIIDTTICFGMAISLGGQTFDSSGVYPLSFTNGNGCDSIVILTLTVLPLQDTNLNVTICPGSSFYFNGQNLSVPGTYQDTLPTSGCDSVVFLHLTVGNYATGAIAAGICAGDSYLFNGETLSVSGVYADTVSTGSGCDSIITLALTVYPTVSDTLFNTICSGSSYFFNGQNLSIAGTYADTLSSTTGCDSIIILHLSVLPPAQSLAIDTAGCGQVVFAGTTYTQSTQLIDTLTSSMGCDSLYKTINITVWNNTPLTGSLDTTGCDAVLYKGTTYRKDTSFLETFPDVHGCDSFLQTTNIHVLSATRDTIAASICQGGYYLFEGEKYRTAGIYTATYSTQHGCDSTLTLVLTVSELPGLRIEIQPRSPQYCIGDKITLTASGGERYHWWNENGTNYGYSGSIQIRLKAYKNVIWLQGYDAQDCSTKKQIILEAGSCCSVFIPTAFTPNGDGLNDQFGVKATGHPQNFRMRIFNRYGTLIYSTEDIKDPWEGTVNGQPADAGTYYYLVTGNCADGSNLKENGSVLLVR